MSLEAPNAGSGPKKPGEKFEQKEFIKPELSIEFNQNVLASLVEHFPDHQGMLERFRRLPPIKFERGKVNFIFGPNGSGKSTLANSAFLAAQVAHSTRRIFDFNKKFGEPITEEEAQREAMNDILHPSRSSRHDMAELIGMAAAPRLVEDGALNLTQFRARGGYSGGERGKISDTPIVHRISVQDMLGEEKRKELDYLFSEYTVGAQSGKGFKSSYAESGASARQMIEEKLKDEFESINPGSIVVMDEAAFGLSPRRQEEYIQMLERLAREKDLIVVAPENSGYAFDASSIRIDLETPERGLHLSETRDSEARSRVEKIGSPEVLPETTLEFRVDHDKIRQLAEARPKFRQMLEAFSKLPESFAFGPGKTEIFADNGGGKTTLLGVMYLLTQIEDSVNDSVRFNNKGNNDKEKLRKEQIDYSVANPSQINDRVFIESLGLARELITSGAVTLANTPQFPSRRISGMEGVGSITWINLLEVSGEIKKDNFNIIGYSESRDVASIADEIKKMRPDRTPGSTRQTAEALLLKTIEHMPEGGFLFVDEIDGGISPDRQLFISDKVHKLAKERKITVIATSNSYEGYKYRLTPSLDLDIAEQGVTPSSYHFAEAA